MKNPQYENGFTKIANEILETVQQFKFNLNELKIIMCIWRFTYGFSRKEHKMSLTFFENHTGLNRGRINESLKKLVDSKVVIKNDQGGKKTNIYSFNKDYDSWQLERYSIHNSSVQNNTSAQNGTSVQSITRTSVQNDTLTSAQFDTQERNKEKLKETNTVESLLSKIESFNDLSGKAGVIVGFMNKKYPDRKRFGIKGNITANDVFTKYLKEGYSAERLLVAIDQSNEELTPWDVVEKTRNVVTESQVKAEHLDNLWGTYELGEDYYREFGDINEYNRAVEELKHLGQL